MTDQGGLMSLGWMLPRSANSERVAHFYGGVFHLPLLRGYGNAWLFWAGGTVVFEPKSDAAPDRRYTDHKTSPSLPVFQTPNLDKLLARLKGRAAILSEENDPYGRIAVIKDIDGHFCLLRQPNEGWAANRPDVGAADPEADAFNPGVPPMPEDITGLNTVIRHVKDVTTLISFYRDIIGMKVLDSGTHGALLYCGDNTFFELRPGGDPETVPADRFEVPDAFILRVADFDDFAAHMRANDVAFVNERIQFGRGALGYVADPEGHLIGFEERYDQDKCGDDAVAFLEDLEANRRWHQRVQSPKLAAL